MSSLADRLNRTKQFWEQRNKEFAATIRNPVESLSAGFPDREEPEIPRSLRREVAHECRVNNRVTHIDEDRFQQWGYLQRVRHIDEDKAPARSYIEDQQQGFVGKAARRANRANIAYLVKADGQRIACPDWKPAEHRRTSAREQAQRQGASVTVGAR